MIGDGRAMTFFNTDQNGVIRMKNASLASDTASVYVVRLIVRDGGTPRLSDTATVLISVTRNNFDPEFQHGNIVKHIPFNEAVGTVIVKVNATDGDQTGPEAEITYSIQSGSIINTYQYFRIYPDSGDIILTRNQGLESIDQFIMRVAATDNGSPRRSGTVSVTVIIDKDPSQLVCAQKPFIFYVTENKNVGFVVGQVTAGTGAIVYTMVGMAPGTSFFAVDNLGSVTISTSLTNDGNQRLTYDLLVEAKRTAVSIQSVTCTVMINVTRNEYGPVFQFPLGLNEYIVTIHETRPPGDTIETVSATDADGDAIAYSITDTDPQTNVFFLHPATGTVTLTQSLRGSPLSKCILYVRASDQRRPNSKEARATVTISIVHDIANPTCSITLQASAVKENAASGTVVGRVTGNDADLRGGLIFRVVGNSTAPAFFTLGSAVSFPGQNSAFSDLVVLDGNYLRRDQLPNYLLTVVVYDSIYPEKQGVCEIRIPMERNLNAPVFNSTNYYVTIPESQLPGSEIFTAIRASDVDNDSLLFEISGPRGVDYSIDPFTGFVSLARSLIGTNHSIDVLTIKARDQRAVNEKTATATLTVTIIRDDKNPYFTNLPRLHVVSKDTAVGSLIYSVSSDDDNKQGQMNFQLRGNYPAMSYFTVNTVTGQVTLIKSLTEDSLFLEKYELAFITYDTFYPNNQATSTLTISVNRNIYDPNCPASIALALDVASQPGVVVATINAYDPDGNSIRYSFGQADKEDNDYFLVTWDTGDIILKKPLTGSPTSFSFTVVSSDQGRPQAKICTTQIQFTLGNDTSPKFYRQGLPTTACYSWLTVESAFEDRLQYSEVEVLDTDLKGSYVFEVKGNLQAPYYFNITSNNGRAVIRPSRSLKEDIATTYELVIEVYDSLRTANRVQCTVTISVDRNPHAPSVDPLTVVIQERTAVSTNIGNVTASDADGDTLEYRLENIALSDVALDYFWIHPSSGSIQIKKSVQLDPAKTPVYYMRVVVTDVASHPKSAFNTVTVRVLRDDYPPVFKLLPYTVEISENTVVASTIYRVTADDQDIRERVVYETMGDGDAPYFFSVDRNNGTVSLANSVLIDSKSSYTLRVRAYDTAYPLNSASATVLINLRRNENAPTFDQTVIRRTIEENVTLGYLVYRLNATDADVRDTVRYSATGESDTLVLFSLDSYTGYIQVKSSLLAATKDQYIMQAMATDNGNPVKAAVATIYITIIRHPGSPVLSPDPCTARISENDPVGTTVLTLRAVDNFLAGSLVYTVDGEYPAQYIFAVNKINNQDAEVKTKLNLRNETLGETEYRLVIEVFDSDREYRRDRLVCTFSVTRNQHPPVLTPYTFEMTENKPYISVVGTIIATDQDANDIITYRILNETAQRDNLNQAGSQAFFQINRETGALNLIQSVKNTGIRQFTLLVEACDNGKPQKCTTNTVIVRVSTVTISPRCDYPLGMNAFVATLNETAKIGDFVMDIKASLNNQPVALVHQLVYPNTIALGIDSNMGRITLAQTLDDSKETRMDFQVRVFDAGTPDLVGTCQATLFINRNLDKPVFSQPYFSVSISEYHQVGSGVLAVNATDANQDQITYSILSSSSTPAGVENFFYLHPLTGELFLRKSLEKTPVLQYVFFVQAEDDHPVNPQATSVRVIINIVPDQYPFFTIPQNGYATLPLQETQSLGSVYKTSAEDRDLVGNITYKVIGTYPAESLLTVNSMTGEITLVRSLKNDPDQLQAYQLRLIAFDSVRPGRSAEASLIFTVVRNPNGPIFKPTASYSFIVSEAEQIGHSVGFVTADDMDLDPVTYQMITPDDGASSYFYLHPAGGQITIVKDLKGTPKNDYNFNVRASDGRNSTSQASVHIQITRINVDQAPVFQGIPYVANVSVRQQFPATVKTVICSNPDLNSQEAAARIRYGLLGYPPGSDYFSLNNQTGAVSLIKDLGQDNYLTQTYTVVVECYDQLNPDKRVHEIVVIHVNRNPNCPQFTSSVFNAFINENYHINAFVLQVNASDADGNNVAYAIYQDSLGITASNYFFITPSMGQMYVRSSLISAQTSFSFTIIASDDGIPPCRSLATVRITIQKDNGRPICQNSGNTLDINDNGEDGRQIYQFVASDNNIQPLRFVPTGDALAWAYFNLSSDGWVTIRRSLKSTQTTRFELFVNVYDEAYPENLGGPCTVTVNVAHNTGVPRFPSDYNVEIFEYEPPGFNFLNVSATDSDGDSVTYSLDNSQFFSISGSSGHMYLLQQLYSNSANVHRISVHATDNRLNPQIGTASVTVTVLRDTAPAFRNLPETIRIGEGLRRGEFVYQLSADDKNQKGSLVYTAIGSEGAPSMFQVNSTGYISARTDLSQDPSVRQYKLVVTVHDSAIERVKTTGELTIIVLRNPNPPVFQNEPYQANVGLQTQIGTVVKTIRAIDADGDNLTYSIIGGTAQQYVVLNPVSGEIILVKDLSGAPQQMTLNVQATDRPVNGQIDTAVVTFIFTVKSLLRFIGIPYETGNINGNTINGTVIYNFVRAVDDDDNQAKIIYGADGLYPADYFFAVNPDSGQISVKNSLNTDSLLTTLYTLSIYAYNTAFPSQRATTQVLIHVVRNPSSPQYDRSFYERTIMETWDFDVSIFNITATDSDGDSVTYNLIKDNNGRAGLSYFYVEAFTGRMYILRPLTDAPDDNYSMLLQATDSGRPSKSTSIEVRVHITRIQAPSFRNPNDSVTVEERSAITTHVYDARASKTPLTGQLKYRLAGSGLGMYYFNIDSMGQVKVAQNLTGREMNYMLLIEAYDDAFPEYVGKMTLTVNMERNQFGPVLLGQPYIGRIDQSSKPGDNILNITASDQDGDRLTYTLEGDEDCKRIFYLHPLTGALYYAREQSSNKNQYSCIVKVTDNGYPVPKEATTSVTINLTTENRPTLTLNTYSARVDETAAIGSSVAQVSASKQPAPTGTIKYEITGYYPSQSFFEIDNNGLIKIINPLINDSLKLLEYKVRIEAYDSAFPLVRGAADMIVSVNRNMGSPQINLVNLKLSETTDPNTWSYAISVSDPDSSVLTCSIEGNPKAQEYFRVDSRTCVLTIAKNLTQDPADTSPYLVTVVATDDGKPPKRTTGVLTIYVDRDRYPTTISLPGVISIDERIRENTSINYNLNVNDQDNASEIMCEMLGDYPASFFFRVVKVNGRCEVQVKRSPINDPDGTPVYYVRVRAWQSTYPNNYIEGVLTINVNRNVGKPLFPAQSFTMRDDSASGSIVYNLSASDPDNDKLRFIMLNTEPEILQTFFISSGGSIVLLRPLDSSDNNFLLRVRATDDRVPNEKFEDATVSVTVQHVKASPRFVGIPYRANVSLDRAVNAGGILPVSATDDNLKGTMTYRTKPFGNAGEYFRLDQNRELILIKSLKDDPNRPDTYFILVEAYDSAVPSDVVSEVIEINVLRNNNNPIFQKSQYVANINDYDPPGTFVQNVSATDSDSQEPENKIVYSLVNPRNALDYFNIDPDSGLVTVSKMVAYDPARPSAYGLVVQARDSGSSPRTATVTLDVSVNRNRAPVFSSISFDRIVGVETDPGTTIVTVQAGDADSSATPNGQLTYSILEESARNLFTIINHNNTGDIILVRSVKGVTQSVWTFTVQVSDGAVLPLTDRKPVQFKIEVTPPIAFIPATKEISISDNQTTNVMITMVSATDPLQLPLAYAIEGDGVAPDYFGINNVTGGLFVKKPLTDDVLTAPRYLVRIAAYRVSDPSKKAYMYLTVLVNRNPNIPRFGGPFIFNITETVKLGYVFGSVSASDPDKDEAGRLVYSILAASSKPTSAVDYFYIDPSTGDLSVKKDLGSDGGVTQYQIMMKVHDNGIPVREASTNVIVNVARNPNKPQFTKDVYEAEINESHPIDRIILTVSALDRDGDRVTYRIIPGPRSFFFLINNRTGDITLSQPVLRDPVLTYEFQVEASDSQNPPGSGTANVIVRVNRNKNAPAFVKPYQNITISEYTAPLSVIASMTATDPDEGISGSLTYYINNVTTLGLSSNEDFFIIGPVDGSIILARDLKRDDAPNQVRLGLRVEDQSSLPKTAYATLDIYIVRNMYAPRFLQDSYSGQELNGAKLGETILTLSAEDDDRNNLYNSGTPNAQIEYILDTSSSSSARFFQIDSVGQISRKTNIVGSNGTQVMTFTATVRDKSWKPKSASVSVSITVLPTSYDVGILGFNQPQYYLAIPENYQTDQSVVELKVHNQGDRAVKCDIVTQVPNEQFFSIMYTSGEKDCILKLLRNLDREKYDRHVLNITVSWKGVQRKKRQTTNYVFNTSPWTEVVIDVLDVNDNNPVWSFPKMPKQTSRPGDGTMGIYIGAIPEMAKPDTRIFMPADSKYPGCYPACVFATDEDKGINGTVEYQITGDAASVPFKMSLDEGLVTTTKEFNSAITLQYILNIRALDKGIPPTTNPAIFYINVIKDINRFVLPVNGMTTAEMLDKIPIIVQNLQEQTGYVIIVEKVESKRIISENNNIQTVADSTDVQFVAGYANDPYVLINTTSNEALTNIMNKDKQDTIIQAIGTDLGKAVDPIRMPYSSDAAIYKTVITKSYLWWLDDPWAPLIALAAIIILLAIVGIVVIIFSHSRYLKFLIQYRQYQVAYPTDFREPANFLREYETQSLNMYVPPDENFNVYGEVGLRLQDEGLVDVQHSAHDPGVAAAVNPVYQSDEPAHLEARAMSQTATIL